MTTNKEPAKHRFAFGRHGRNWLFRLPERPITAVSIARRLTSSVYRRLETLASKQKVAIGTDAYTLQEYLLTSLV